MENQPLRSGWQGKLIGRYQLEKLLGRGGTSEVWLATDTQLRRQVALKILPTATNDQTYLQDFAYEARAAAALEHPHILGIHDFGEQEIEPGEVIPYLVMPYVSGGTLAERMSAATGPLVIPESLRYLRQAALAIDYAHSKHVLHRDIKPSNMLLREDWLLLTDFGLAKVLNTSLMRGQTYSGSGTPEYMAPEQIMGQALPASDRYSLAVVAYQLFTGRPPFQGATPGETITQQMQAPLPPPRQLNPQIPLRVENLLTVALSRNPELRPPTCNALVDALQQAWMSGVQTEPSADATLIAPWSRRSQSLISSQSLPSVSGETAVPARPSVPLTPGITPVLPPLSISNTPGQTSPNFRTVTDPGSGPLSGGTAADPFATGSGSNFETYSSPLPPPAGPVPPAPGRLEKKVGRRGILLGGAAAAVLVVGGGVAALEVVRTRGSQNPPLATPTPVPGPRKLIPGQPILSLKGHSDEVWTATWHPGGRYLLTAGKDGYIMLWDLAAALQNAVPGSTLATPRQKWTVAGIKFENLTDKVCWSLDGQKVIVGGSSGNNAYVLNAFGTSTSPTVYNDVDLTILGDDAIYDNVTAGPGVDQFTILNIGIVGSQEQVWRFGQTDAPVVNYDVKEDVSVAKWSRDGSMLAAITGGLANTNGFYLWKGTNRTHPSFFNRPQRDKALTFFVLAETLAWSPVDPHLLLINDADEALIWDVRHDTPLLVLSAPVDSSTPVISKLSWSPNGRYVAASYDAPGDNASIPVNPRIYIWDVQASLKAAPTNTAQRPALSFSSPPGALSHSQSILDLNWSPDGRYIATSSLDKSVIIWKVDGQ